MSAASSTAVERSSGSALRAAWDHGPLAFVVLVAVVLVCAAVFIHVAASIAGLEKRSIFRAVKAAALSWFLALVVAFITGFACGVAGLTSDLARYSAAAICALLPGTLAIRSVYEAGWPKALWTWIIASVLTLVVFCAGMFALATWGAD